MRRCTIITGLVLVLVAGLALSSPGMDTYHALGMSEETEAGPPPSIEMAIRDGFAKALQDCVRGLLGFSFPDDDDKAPLEQIYRQPQRFIPSYRVLQETTLGTGYMVLLEVTVDTDMVRVHLRQVGLLADIPSIAEPRKLRVVVRGMKGYKAYRDVETLLGDEREGGKEVTIAEMEPGRFVWNVATSEDPAHLADRFQRGDVGGHRVLRVTKTDAMLEIELEPMDHTTGGGSRQ